MAKVSNIKIIAETGANNTYFATWDFNEVKNTTAASSTIKAGTIVKIKAGAKYYNGVAVPQPVYTRPGFKVKSISGDRAILGASTDGQYKDINSPVSTQYLTIVSGGSTSGGSTTTTDYNKTLDHYEVEWHYHTGQKNKDGTNIWFGGGASSVTIKQSDGYSPPDNATHIRVRIKPVSKTYKVKSGDSEVEKSYWSGESVFQWYNMSYAPPEKPGEPTVEQDGLKLTLKIQGIEDVRTDKIRFQILNTENKKTTNADVVVRNQEARYTFTLAVGNTYYARCQAINNTGGSNVYSEWSNYVYDIKTPPAGVAGFKCSAYSETEIKVSWYAVTNADSYDIQYTTESKYFDISDTVSSKNVEGRTTDIISVDTGHTYYFRIRAVNDKGESGWSKIISATVGSQPEPPTTWSLSSTAIVGEDVTLYWVHNAEDESSMTEAKIELNIDGVISVVTVPGKEDEDKDDEDPIHSYIFNTKEYTDGATIKWKVQTKGAIATYSDWSTQRTIDLYAPPTVELSLATNTIEETVTTEDGTEAIIARGAVTTYPLELDIVSGPTTQTPISYHVSIVNKEAYESVDVLGSTAFVSANTNVYSKVFTTSEHNLSLALTAGDVHLENGQTYVITVTAAMDSGLTGTGSVEFFTSWDAYVYEPDASIGIDDVTLTAYITPYCADTDGNLAEDVTLSLYRREFNGLFTPIATDIPNTGIDTIVDPHPALDYARYRVVALHATTGAISYEDLPGHPVNIHDIVIQWDETWTNFDYTEDAPAETPPWTGSMLRFPYNIDVTETYAPDVSLVNYVGREHPVSYFGTHRGETATWNTVIPATDKETVYQLRRLAAYRGNVYVREPSGTGYWACIKVSFPQKHKDLTIAVSFTITRVEGGI